MCSFVGVARNERERGQAPGRSQVIDWGVRHCRTSLRVGYSVHLAPSPPSSLKRHVSASPTPGTTPT